MTRLFGERKIGCTLLGIKMPGAVRLGDPSLQWYRSFEDPSPHTQNGRPCPKGEHTTFSTTLDTAQVKSILSSVLSGATVEPLNQGPLDGDAAIAILATQRGGIINKSPFGYGIAVAQIFVEDHGSARSVELIAIRATFGDNLNRQRGAANAFEGLRVIRETPNPKAGRAMVAAILGALKAADPSIPETS